MNILEISNNIIKVLKKISNSPTGVTFVSLDYTKSSGERAKHLINVGASYAKAKEKDIETLEKLDVSTCDTDISIELLNKAKEALIKALKKPSKNRSEGQKNAYVHLCTGFKECIASGDIHIYGMSVSKTVITKGEYKKTNKRALTIAKDFLRKNHMKSTKFRTFIIKNADSVK